MPLIIDPSKWTETQLKEQALRLCDGLVELSTHLARPPVPPANPWAWESCISLIRESTELAAYLLARARSEKVLLAHVTNQLYEVGASIPIFLKFAEAPPPPTPSRTPKPA
jgi:hypothetical protein